MILVSLAALVGISGGYAHGLGASERPATTVAELAETVAASSAMSSSRWRPSAFGSPVLPNRDAAVRWDDGSDTVGVTVTAYPSPYAAAWAFVSGDPAGDAADGFESSPYSVAFDVDGPDQQSGWCVAERGGGCLFWMYQARFGQYLLLVDRFDPGTASEESEFAAYVGKFVRAMNTALSPH
ncbi:hypothetical protein [Catellatospora methionotrophica]|uniref:hypothetical protein n=1 Tax=Catellatospora methionotrophica TaxID=121620 RepID=UPI0033E39436